MSFSNAELQQLRALTRAQIDKLEIDRIASKQTIADMVQQKQPFKQAGTKSVVDKINDSIRDEYRVLDGTEKKLKKLVTLQKAIKRETQRNGQERRVFYIDINKGADANFDIPATTEALKSAMDKFRFPSVAAGYAQVVGSQPPVDTQSVFTTTTDNPSDGFLPPGWSDFKMEQFPAFGGVIASPAYDLPQPSFRTLELRPEDIDNRWYIGTQPNRIVNPGFGVQERRIVINEDGTQSGGLFGVKEGMKPSNPKDMIGSDKLPLHLWPATATAMGCIGFLNGLLKYGRANFRVHGIRASIYIDAAKRHLDAWFEGEECDPDDGVPHLSAALACIGIVVDALAAGKLNDDRNVRGGYRKLVGELTPHVARLKKLHEGKDPKHYTIADNASLV
jgi:hypothetical protein